MEIFLARRRRFQYQAVLFGIPLCLRGWMVASIWASVLCNVSGKLCFMYPIHLCDDGHQVSKTTELAVSHHGKTNIQRPKQYIPDSLEDIWRKGIPIYRWCFDIFKRAMNCHLLLSSEIKSELHWIELQKSPSTWLSIQWCSNTLINSRVLNFYKHYRPNKPLTFIWLTF
jgi:hypothetical protein